MVTLAEFNRRPKIYERISGFIIDYSESFILLQKMDWGSFSLNGYTLIRQRDVKKSRFFDKQDHWQWKAVKKLKVSPEAVVGVPLTTWSEAIFYISRHFSLPSIHPEIAKPDFCYVGRLIRDTPKTLVLDDLSSNCEWTGERIIKTDQITRVDFNGGYEAALTAVAPKRK